MAKAQQRFLRPELLARIPAMEIRARTVVEGVLTGLHQSPFRGLSIEFAEYRQYQPGDDIRFIDWKAYARSDKYYIKENEDETNLDAHIILDASASMDFGSGKLTKWQYAATLAATLAFLFQRQNDAIGLAVLDEQIRFEMEARGTRGHLVQFIGQLEKTAPGRKTRLADSIHSVASRITRRGIVILITDMLDDLEAVLTGLRHLQFGGNDVAVFHIMDPAERNFSFDGPTLFVDPETNQVVPALPLEMKAKYLEAIGQFITTCSEEMGRGNIWYFLTDTSEPLDRPLISFITRARR